MTFIPANANTSTAAPATGQGISWGAPRPQVRRLRRSLLAASLGALMLSGLPLAAQAASEAQFEPALATFLRAAAGDEGAIAKSVEAFGALLQAEPASPVLMAYAGAATTLQATTTFLPWKKMRYAEDGLALLDKALALPGAASSQPLQHQVPAVLDVRFTAASTFLAVPGFMNRAARGQSLLNEVLSSPLLATAPLDFKGSVWLTAARQAAAQGNKAQARSHLQHVIDSGAPQSAAARGQLAALGS